MVKYLFNGKAQIFTNGKGHFHFYLETNCKNKYGQDDIFDNALGLGFITLCW